MISWRRAISPNQIIRLSETTNIHSVNRACNSTVQQSVIEIHSARAEDGVEYICQAQNYYYLSDASSSKQLKINVQSGSTITAIILWHLVSGFACIQL